MELKYVVPNMEKTFGNLEFAGEKEVITARDDKKGKYIAKRSYNLYSDVQKGENVVVEIKERKDYEINKRICNRQRKNIWSFKIYSSA